MKSKKVIITQSNYIPWKGYFDAFAGVDEVVLYDDMQYTKRDWRNRNQIKTPQGLQWLSIPVEVKGKFFQSIQETKISEEKWAETHYKTLKNNYSKAPFFKNYQNVIEEAYLGCEEVFLSKINERFLKLINKLLGIGVPMRFSSEFRLVEGKTERLVDLCKQLGATDYYTGASAQGYMQESMFVQENIQVHYLDHAGYPEYPQLYPPFAHHVSILDLLFHTGEQTTQYMKNLNPNEIIHC